MTTDDIEKMADENIYKEHRESLLKILDALQPLNRDDRRVVMECARQFFELPKHE